MEIKDTQQSSELKSSSSLTVKNEKKTNLSKYKQNPTKELEELLVQENYGLVVSQALCYLNDPNFEDYIQAGLIGLLKAIRHHDEKMSKFSTFASVCVKNSIKNLNKKLTSYSSRKSGQVIDKNRSYNNKESLIEYIPELLDEESKFIISLRLQNYTNAEIADLISQSKDYVKSKVRSSVKLLKEFNK